MTTYEAGFSQGEHDAFRDRRRGIEPEAQTTRPMSAYQRGYADGYTPRTSTWGARLRTPPHLLAYAEAV